VTTGLDAYRIFRPLTGQRIARVAIVLKQKPPRYR
jgi:hypothetical protein